MLMNMLSNQPTGKYPKHKERRMTKNVIVKIVLSEFVITKRAWSVCRKCNYENK